MSEVRTLRGQRASLRLPDGSEVSLGPATTIRYAVDPRHGPRSVYLDGEAYLTVTHDAARPFTVHTAYGVAVDLGTRFGVRAYQADSAVQVTVQEGRVALEAAHSSPHARVVLAAHDVGTATAAGRLWAERGVEIGPRLAWKDGRLELRAVPLREAVIELSRWYGVDVRLGDSVSANRPLRASFQTESVDEALQLIAATLALRIERHGESVTFLSQRSS